MNVKRFLISALLLGTIILSVSASVTDSVRIANLEEMQLAEVKAREDIVVKIDSLSRVISNLRKQLERVSAVQRQSDLKQNAHIDSLYCVTQVNEKEIITTAERLGLEISDTNSLLGSKADSVVLQQRTLIGAIITLLLALSCLIVFLLLRSRILKGSADVEALRKKAEELNEQIVDKMASEMTEIKNISEALSTLSSKSSQTTELDHSLIKTLADRITFMEMTLYKMDSSIRGHKQLSRSIIQMKDNLKVNGYELVDMLGKDYNDGMKVTATFIEDENIPEGKQIISGIIKPQINYNGIMIQSAQITVSQNI